MKINVVSNINAGEILRRRGLQAGGPVQRMFTQECANEMDRYVPMQSGTLKNTRFVGPDYVKYNQPYAHYLYTGALYVDPVYKKGCFYDPKTGRVWSRPGVKKIPSDQELTYHGAPMRGKLWDVRMWADNKRKLLNMVAKACGGRVQ